MRLDKFTIKSQELVSQAQTLASEKQHQQIEPEHFLAAMAAENDVGGAAASLATQTRWDPFQFVDLYQRALREGGELESLVRRAAQREWQLLFDFSYRSALGEGQ